MYILRLILLTGPPEIDSEQHQEKKQEYRNILKKDKVRFFYNKSAHAKIVVVDRAVAIVSSMNFSPRSSGGVSWEAGIVTVEQTVVEAIADSRMSLEVDRLLTYKAAKIGDKHYSEKTKDVTKLDIAKWTAAAKYRTAPRRSRYHCKTASSSQHHQSNTRIVCQPTNTPHY